NFMSTPPEIDDKGLETIKQLTTGSFGYSILRSCFKRDYFSAIFDQCEQIGITLVGVHSETGPGVYEGANQYSDILTAADRATLFKTSIKEIAYQHGVMATFMAKWSSSLPGNGGHVHQSLWDKEGDNNLFYDKEDPLKMSNLMKNYIAGQLY